MSASVFVEDVRGSFPLHRPTGRRDKLHRFGIKDTMSRRGTAMQSSYDRKYNHHGRHGNRERQSSNVRRTLAFNTEDDDDDFDDKGLDFTDKMAAFRSLIKPMKNPVSILKSTHTEDDAPKINSQTFTVNSNKESDVRISRNDKDMLKARQSLLSRKVDEELSRMSFINYQAHLHVMGTGGEKNGWTPQQDSKNNNKSSVSKVLGEYLREQDRNKRCQNFSEGLVSTVNGEEGRSVRLAPGISHNADGFSGGKRGRESATKVYRGQSQSNVDGDFDDLLSENVMVDCDVKASETPAARPNVSSGSDPLSDVASLLNKDGGRKSVKSIQSNVPHYHPGWSSQNKEQSQRSRGHVLKHRHTSPRVSEDVYDVKNNLIDSNHIVETTFQTNVQSYVGTPNSQKNNKKRERISEDRSGEYGFYDSPKMSKSRSHRSSGQKSKHQKSFDRDLLSKVKDSCMSDSSKENVPDVFWDSEDSTANFKREKHIWKHYPHISDEECEIDGNIRPGKNRRKGNTKSGSLDKVNNRTCDKRSSDRDYHCLSDESLQKIPERDLSSVPGQVSKTTAQRPLKKYDSPESRLSDGGSFSGSVWSSSSQSSIIQAAELIKRLYKADPTTREDLILKARFFRRWLKAVRCPHHKRFSVDDTLEEEVTCSTLQESRQKSSPVDYVFHQSTSQKYVDNSDTVYATVHPTQYSHRVSDRSAIAHTLSNVTEHASVTTNGALHSTLGNKNLWTGGRNNQMIQKVKNGENVQPCEDAANGDYGDMEIRSNENVKVIVDQDKVRGHLEVADDNLAHTRLLHIENFLEDALQEWQKNAAGKTSVGGSPTVGKNGENFAELDEEVAEILQQTVARKSNRCDSGVVGANIDLPTGRVDFLGSNDVKLQDITSAVPSVKLVRNQQRHRNGQKQNNCDVDLLENKQNFQPSSEAGQSCVSDTRSPSEVRRHIGSKFVKIQKRKRDSTTSQPIKIPDSVNSEQQLLDTANYGVCLQRAEVFLRERLLKTCFQVWKNCTATKLKASKADSLHRYHSLRKGMKAFSWAISRSRIQVDILQARITNIVLSLRFAQWRDLAMKNRRQRLERSFVRWQCFTLESQKVRKLRCQREYKILQQAMTQWRTRFLMRLKENQADRHFRTTLLTKQITCWKLFTVDSKEKKSQDKSARLFYSHHLEIKMFEQMVMVFQTCNVAKTHHRRRTLRMVLLAWRQASYVCKVERQRDMSVSREHWRLVTAKRVFSQWHDQLLVHRTHTNRKKQLTRNAFHIWRVQWITNLAARLECEARLRREILSTSLQLWHANVAVIQKRRHAGIVYLQRVLVRHALLEWRAYTRHRKDVRRIMTVYTRTKNLQNERRCFSVWHQAFKDRLDVQKAKNFWSTICVRKAVVQWRRLCHRRMLKALLEATQPIRSLNLQRAMFQRWLDARLKVQNEKYEADQIRRILERSQLQRRFHTWWIATQQRLTIKPLLLRQQRAVVTEMFDSWHWLVLHKAQCKRSSRQFITAQLRTKFAVWRRQYLVHQLEKDVCKTNGQNRLRRVFHGWHLVIKRKHSADSFHQRELVKQSFLYWREKALGQLERRIVAKERVEYHMSMLRCHFDLWVTSVHKQTADEEAIVVRLEQERTASNIRKSFVFWRRHFRAVIIARENQVHLCRKLQLQALREWHHYTQAKLCDAVHAFAVRLGLESPGGNRTSMSSSICDQVHSPTSDICQSPQNDGGERSEPFMSSGSVTPRRAEFSQSAGPGTPRRTDIYQSPESSTPRRTDISQSPGPGTPRRMDFSQSPGPGTPNRRLFSPSLSLWSLDFDQSTPEPVFRPSLADRSFLDTRFAMEQAVKTEKLRTLVFHAVKRLRFWPISVAFDQWKEYTSRQQELKALSNQLQSYIKELEMRRVFRLWRTSQLDSRKAKQYRDSSLMSWAFTTLYQHKCIRKQKKELSALAHQHLSLKVFRKIFPVWFAKAQEKSHQERVCHLWTHLTPEEQNLLPLETEVKGRLQAKTLQKCFVVWNLKFQQIYKLKKAFSKVSLQRYFEEWYTWAHQRRDGREKSVAFFSHRLQKQVFDLWRLRCQQKSEVEQRHKEVWQSHLVAVVREWRRWTVACKQRRRTSGLIQRKHQLHLVVNTFMKWRLETSKYQQIQVWYQTRLALKVYYSWHEVTRIQRTRKRQVLEFRVKSYTKLVGQLFHTWYSRYVDCLRQHQEHEKVVRMRALQFGRRWRRNAQTTRGRHLQQLFKRRQIQSCFWRWRTRYDQQLEREDVLACHIVRKDQQLVREYLGRWKTSLLCHQAGHVFDTKLITTVFTEWRQFTAESKVRRTNCAAFQVCRQQHSLMVQFLYWVHLTRVRQSIHHHFNLKLQIRVLRAWAVLARRRRKLKTLGNYMTVRVNRRLVTSTWYTMREQFDYYHSLTDMANKVVCDKNQKCMRRALAVWREKLNRVVAGHCYNHMLARRGVRTWHQFVYRRKQERQHDREQEMKAVTHYNRHLCRTALETWHDEVLVVHQIQRHSDRLSHKYGRLWKLRVDMMFTAQLVAEEHLYKTCWHKWRIQFARQVAVQRMTNYNDKHLLAQIFVAWKRISLKTSGKYWTPTPSSIPVLRLPPTGVSSSESTPTPSPRPTQIPGPCSGRGSSGVGQTRFSQRRPSVPGILPTRKN